MKKFYSLVLMAAALLIGTNAWADASVSTWAELKTALQAGGTVTLSTDINVAGLTAANCIWIGSEAQDGDAPEATLDLNGHNIIIKPAVKAINPFALTKGSLKVTSSSPATIEVQEGDVVINTGTNVFTVFGADLNHMQDPKTNPFSHLEIDANVTVKTENGTVIAVDELTAAQGAITGLPSPKPTYTTHRYAFGACVDVKGTLISQGAKTKSQGTDGQKCYGIKINGSVDYVPEDSEKPYAAYVHVHPSAVITTDYTFAKAAACYASGYGRWLIEGTCTGAIGVYAGKGDVVIKDATVKSGAETYTAPTSAGGANGSGSGVVINSRGGTYDGEVHVTITGDSKVESKDGYAVEERVNTTDGETNVSSLTISGGTFVGDQEKGAIIVTEKTAETTTTTISIAGGNITGTTGVIGTDSLATYLSNHGDTHATLVTDEKGNTTLVISGGDAPTGMADFVSNADLSVKWTGASKDITGTFALKELEINESSAQILTVKENATFTVGRVVLGKDAKIIVEAGGKFIVTGAQGIVSPSADNILLKASETAQATFLFNPAVTSNRHPNAKVEYHSNSFYNSAEGFNVEQFMGIPTYNGAVTNIETTSDAKIYFDLWRKNTWDYIGAINVPGDPNVMANLNKFNLPFGLVCITSKNDAAHKPTFTFSGELAGNIDHSFTLLQDWTTLANAYMGSIDKNAILAQLATWNAAYGTTQAVYFYEINPSTGTLQWKAYSNYNLPATGINAMRPMMFYNANKVDGLVLDYSALVWDPLFPAQNPAPARREASNITKVQINIAGENEADYTTIVADSELGDDKSFCAPKYNNPGLQLYVMGNEKYDIYAVDDIENSYVGYRTVNAGMYTISFENVQGEDLVLVDLANGARTNIEEGAIYTFHAEANESNDYRFEIVGRANMPTAIDNTEAVKSAKGIYTLTGQYMGEMNVWNSLPAGVYVVNGEKRVK